MSKKSSNFAPAFEKTTSRDERRSGTEKPTVFERLSIIQDVVQEQASILYNIFVTKVPVNFRLTKYTISKEVVLG